MPKKNHWIAFFIIALLFTACSDNEDNSLPTYQAGVVLTLDDDYVNEWKTAHTILQEYSWKATFCVSKVDELNPKKINILKELQDYGHEIAGHGLNHLNAVSMTNSIGFENYFNQEINPMMTCMNTNNLIVESFAYPFGARNNSIDDKLFHHFKVLRGTTYGSGIPSQQNCFYKNSNLVLGLGIDNSYSHFSVTYFIRLLECAKSKNKILVLYAHKPVTNATEDYQTEMNTLIQICDYVKLNHMKFYTLSELYNL